MRRAEEHFLHDAEQVKGYLDEALRIVRELEIYGDLAGPAFVQAVTLLAQKQVFFEEISSLPSFAIPRNAKPGN